MCKRLIYPIFVVSLLATVAVQAQSSPYDRVAYWDGAYGAAWCGGGEGVRDAMEQAGYRVVDAAELKRWMDGHIVDGELSVVVMCRDVVPDTVAETQDTNCTIRRYLDAGGKVVWYSDWPFYYRGTTDTTWGVNGAIDVLGFDASGGTNDSNDEVTITEAGAMWGLTETWISRRPVLPDAWDNLTVLAVDDVGNAAAWVAHYVEGDTFRGFVRIHDHGSGDGEFSIDNLIAVAEYVEFFRTATAPVPFEGAVDVPRDVVLGWTAGDFAAAHDVYFGTSFDDVNAASRGNPLGVLVSEGQAGTTYDFPGLLELGQTYYWRIDEVNAAPGNEIFRGGVWSFTAEPIAYPIENIIATSNATSNVGSGPEKTIDGSGLNTLNQHSINASDMWLTLLGAPDPLYIEYEFDQVYKLYEMLVWNYNVQFEVVLGFGLKDVTVEYSENGRDWVVLSDVEFAQGTTRPDYTANTTIAFGGVAAQYVKLSVNSAWGEIGQYGLSEVRFLFIPVTAREPQPADGAAGVSVNTELAWRAGRDSISHEVSLGTDAEALALVDTVEAAGYAPGNLDLDTMYYWKIDEVQDAESWEGAIWSFATQAYLVVEDFESYDDDENRIYLAWVDGYEINANGSTVGNLDAPFAEMTIVHGGGQSMPLFYDNTGTTISEAEYTFGAQDWTANDVKSLSLYFHGAADNDGQLYVKINNTKIVYDGEAVNIARPAWQLWSIDLSTAGNVSGVSSLTIGIEGAGAQGVIYIDDIGLYPEVFEYLTPDITGAGDTVQGVPNDGVTTGGDDNGWPAGEIPDQAIDDDAATKFLHFKGGAEPTGLQITPLAGATIVTGVSFTTANDAAERDPASFELYGSNASIDGPYTLIASGDIVDFTQATAWPRSTKNETPISFDNTVAYAHYQVLFPTVRDPDNANSMQIAEVELLP